MGAINKVKPSFFGATHNKRADSESTIPLGTVPNPEATMATVMMTGIYDTREQTQFNRLMLMAEDDTVAETYPLTRKLTHVGRSRRNHVRLKDPLVSTRHFSVSLSDSTCVINDLDSSNGTFLNGERLSGGRVLKDGDEVMLGKTILRFATRQSGAAAGPKKARWNPVVPANRKRALIRVATVLCIVISATIILMQTHNAFRGPAAHGPALAAETEKASPPASEEHATAFQTPAEADKATSGAGQPESPGKTTHIQRALADYAAGLLYNARQTLKMLSMAGEVTPDALTARRTLSMIGTVQELHAQALEAQAQKKYTQALEYWDRLLLADMELVGDRPSFFAMQAEQKVQNLSYEYALEAYRLKNFQKARQLCHVILKINPKNQEALALLAKIDPKA
jgi:pSer/pThr/pTyr-binding forkhead associated (FHA) protein